MEDWFVKYYMISGLICFASLWWDINYSSSKEDIEDLIGDATWKTGINRDLIRCCVYAGGLIFGCIIIPWQICSIIKEILWKKEQ
jgi:hypothetical protein